MELTVRQCDHAKTRSDDEITDVADETSSSHPEGSNQGHRAGYDGSNETGSTKELTDGQAATIGAHGCEGREDIRTAISKGQKRHAGQAFAHAQDAGDSAEIDTEKVTGGNADRAEKQRKPQDEDNKCEGLNMAERAVIELEVGEQAFFVGAVGAHEGTLIFGMTNEATLYARKFDPVSEMIRKATYIIWCIQYL